MVTSPLMNSLFSMCEGIWAVILRDSRESAELERNCFDGDGDLNDERLPSSYNTLLINNETCHPPR